MAKSKKELSKKALAKEKKGVKLVIWSHRDTAKGMWTDVPEDPPVVQGKNAVVVESIVMHQSMGKKEKRPHYMADIKV